MSSPGSYGARVNRTFKTGGAAIPPGTLLTAETVMKWPLANRKALENAGFITFLAPPAPAPKAAEAPLEQQRQGQGQRR